LPVESHGDAFCDNVLLVFAECKRQACVVRASCGRNSWHNLKVRVLRPLRVGIGYAD
jgi:hypothetical protein